MRMVRGSKSAFLTLVVTCGLTVGACSSATSPADPSSGAASPSVAMWQPPVAPTQAKMSAADAKKVDDAARKALKESPDKTPGMIIGIWDPEKGYYVAAYGDAERGGAKMTTDTHMYIGSITKTATAAAILRLVDQGKLALSDTVEQVDPELANKYPPIAKLTIKQLLAMASGLPDYANPPGKSMPKLLADPSTNFTPDDLISDALDSAPLQPAGSGAYINTNYIILGEILAKVTGKPANEVINQVFADVGLTNTKLEASGTAGLPEPKSHGYYGDQQAAADKESGTAVKYDSSTDVSDWNISWAGSAGGAYSTVADLQKWAASGSGTILLSEELAKQRLSGISVIDASITEGTEGLGLFNRDGWIGHGGQLIGWQSEAKYDTKTGAVFVALVNSTGGLADAQKVRDLYFPELAGIWPGINDAVQTAEFVIPGLRPDSPSPSDSTASSEPAPASESASPAGS